MGTEHPHSGAGAQDVDVLVDVGKARHAARVARSRRFAFLRAAAFNAGLLAYFLLLVRFLFTDTIAQPVEDSSFPSAGWSAVIGALLGVLWTAAPLSPGRRMAWSTDPILKSTQPVPEGRWWLGPHGLVTLALIALTVFVGARVTDVSARELFDQSGLKGAGRIFSALFHPDWSKLGDVIEAMFETIFIAFLATLIAVPMAFVLSFPTARNLTRSNPIGRGLYVVLRFLFNFTRSVEPIVWAIVFSVWVGIGPFAGMLALMVHSVASLAKLYSEQVESVDPGPIEAIQATGARPLQVLWYGVVPQVVRPFLSFTIYRWDINVRMATILGLVGGGGVGQLLMQAQGQARWSEVGAIAIVIFLVVWTMDALSARLREALT